MVLANPSSLLVERRASRAGADLYAALQRDPYRSASVAPRALGQALLVDGLELADVDGEVNSREALLILRFARALGCTAEDIRAATHELDEWLPQLG